MLHGMIYLAGVWTPLLYYYSRGFPWARNIHWGVVVIISHNRRGAHSGARLFNVNVALPSRLDGETPLLLVRISGIGFNTPPETISGNITAFSSSGKLSHKS